MALDAKQAQQTLATMRLAIGTAATVMPTVAGKLFFLDPAGNPQLPMMGRLFGVRNAAIGVTLLDGTEEEQLRWLRYGVAIDAIDALAIVGAGLRGRISKRAMLAAGATAVLATTLGVAALQDR
jgi:hypothetical protein